MMDGVAMDLYDDLSDMIACDMRSDFDTVDLTPLSAADLGELSDPTGDSPLNQQVTIHCINSTLVDGNTPPNSVDAYSTLDSELVADSGISWYQNNPQLYAVNNSDFEQTGGGLMVNPQTGVPISSDPSILTSSLSPASVGSSSVTSSSSVFMSTPPHEGLSLRAISNSIGNGGNDQTGALHLSGSKPIHQPRSMLISNQARTKPVVQRKNSKEILAHDTREKVFPKPSYSYSCLIAMALKNSNNGSLPVSEIYSFMTENFPYFKIAPNGWKNSVRHNLSLNKCFEKIEKPGPGSQRKGCLWAMNPEKIEKMDEEVQKWKRKDPNAIRLSMAKPEILERLERGEVKSGSPKTEEMTADSTTEVGQSPDTTPSEPEYNKSVENVPPLPDLVIQNAFWEELNNSNVAGNQGISIKNEVSTSTTSRHLEQMLNRSSSAISSSSSPHHSMVSSSTSDLQGNYTYTNRQVIKQEAGTWAQDNLSSQDSPELEDKNENGNLLDSQDSNLFHQTNNRAVSALI